MKAASLLLAVSLLAALPAVQAHDHLAATVTDLNGIPEPTDPLQLFAPTISGNINSKTYRLVLRPTGENYAGYYSLDEFPHANPINLADYFSFTVWSNGETESNPPQGTTYAPPTGSVIRVEVVSVSGPAGGIFGFWESGVANTQNTPTRSFPVGVSTGGYTFQVTDPFPENPGDPWGHVHDRGWTVNIPGDYAVTFRLRDQSGLVANSPDYTFHFTTNLNAVPALPLPARLAAGALLLGLGAFAIWRKQRPALGCSA